MLSQEEKQFWEERFNSIKVDWITLTRELLNIVEKSTKATECAKNEIENSKDLLQEVKVEIKKKPFNWTALFQFLQFLAIVIFIGYAIFSGNGCVKFFGQEYRCDESVKDSN